MSKQINIISDNAKNLNKSIEQYNIRNQNDIDSE